MPASDVGFYTVSVEASFSATHRLALADGGMEPLHGHDWKVQAHFSRRKLDARGMVVDFHEAQSALNAIAASLHHTDLNANPELAGLNPTAEVMARFFFDRLCTAGLHAVYRVNVTEAPGCVAGFESVGLPGRGSPSTLRKGRPAN